MNYFPVFFDLKGQSVLVVGAGEVALRKIVLLERTGAVISVVAPQVEPALMARSEAGSLSVAIREFMPSDLDGARLVIVATSRRAVNRWIANLSERRGIPVNVVDDRVASRFIVPAIVDRDPVLVAISTGGTSPVLARRLRERLESLIPTRIGKFALWLRSLRQGSSERLRNTQARRRFFEMVIDGPAAERFIAGDAAGAERIAQQLLATTATSAPAAGSVTLVGAGPGDPELLTLKALRALQDADVILHDRLVSPAILEYARRDAQRISVGKAAGSASTSQADINRQLIDLARQGMRVVRLKGGDPFIFGRGGEELEALAAASIDFRVIPGITAALGVAAYAGIPLTHRDHAHSVTLVTGHADQDGRQPDWVALARTGSTAVFYMGLGHLEHIVQELQRAGAPADRPVAVITHGTLPEQRSLTATLATICAATAAVSLESPALLVVGEVVGLHPTLAWFQTLNDADLSRSA